MDRFFYKFNLKKQGEKRKESLRCLSFSLSLLQLASSMLRKVGARCKQSQLKKNTLMTIQRKIIQTKLITRIIFFFNTHQIQDFLAGNDISTCVSFLRLLETNNPKPKMGKITYQNSVKLRKERYKGSTMAIIS